MTRGKRRNSKIKGGSPPKKPRRNEDVIEIDTDSGDELTSILAQIKESEERERRARDRQHHDAGPSDFVALDAFDTAGDEALARSLAQAWAEVQGAGPPTQSDGPTPCEVRPTSVRDDTTQMVEGRKQRTVMPGELDTPDIGLRDYRDFFTGTKNCSKCHEPVPAPRGHVTFENVGSGLPTGVTHLLHAPCTSCCTNHCRGCWTPTACPAFCQGTPNKGACPVAVCCAGARAIAIFGLLGGLDRQIIAERTNSSSRALASLSEKKAQPSNSVGPGGTGYGAEDDYDGYGDGFGTGSDGSDAEDFGIDLEDYPYFKVGRRLQPKPAPPESPLADPAARQWDETIVQAFNALTELLPSPYSDAAQVYDFVPHASIRMLLSLSTLPELLASLLRNDSITDWTARNGIYAAMLTLLRRMTDCELTVQVLLEPRWEVVKTPGLESWMWDEGEIIWQKDKSDSVERGLPLYQHFKRLIKQGEAFMATVSRLTDSNGSEEHETIAQVISLYHEITATGAILDRIISILGTFRPTETSDSEREAKEDSTPAVDQAYAKACEKLAFKYAALAVEDKGKGKKVGLSYPDFRFSQQLERTRDANRNPKSHFRLASELANMATSLPSGVWICVDEVRNDAIKIMIAGPEGTPYEGGLFEFDCFVPLEYPNVPPLVNLCTTGGGSVGFNPNLYADGTVCLSLLGTWEGRPEEQWGPKSTLLQVIISIQGMIFVEAPYYNEPGMGKVDLKSFESIEYNRNTSMETVQWAILDWLQHEHLNGIWKDVIASHFSIKKHKIRERIVEWVRTAQKKIARYANRRGKGKFAAATFSEPDYDDMTVPRTGRGRGKGKGKAVAVEPDFVAEFDQRIQLISDRKQTELVEVSD